MNKYIFHAGFVVSLTVVWQFGAVLFVGRDMVRATDTIIDVAGAVAFMVWLIWLDRQKARKQIA